MNKTGRNRWSNVHPAERFFAKADIDWLNWQAFCWIWRGRIQKNGYGLMTLDGKREPAHRAAYLLFRGEIGEGLDVDHLCRNRACVNPWHLEVVTHRENLLRGDTFAARHARQTHCKRGHEFTAENTRITKRGERHCRACHRARRYATRHGLDFESYARTLPVEHIGGHGKSPHPNMDELGDRVRDLVGGSA